MILDTPVPHVRMPVEGTTKYGWLPIVLMAPALGALHGGQLCREHAMKERREKIQSFLRGFGSVIDITGAGFRPSEPPKRMTDGQALRSDWEVIGNDFRKAMDSNRPKQLAEQRSR